MTRLSHDEVIQRIAKRQITPSDQGSIPTLNDLPAWMVDEARAIASESRLSAVRYLRFYVARHYLSSAEDFVEDVLEKGQDAATWQIRDCLCFPMERTYTTALEIQYLDILADEEGERWFRMKLRPTDDPSSWTPGAVGVLKRNVRYWHQLSDAVGAYSVAADDIEPVAPADLPGCVRRWIAHRIAWWTRSYLQRHPDTITGADLITAVPDADPTRVTPDAWIAASALAREAAAFGSSPQFPHQAGFLGPDEWYQALPPTDATTANR
jgi:hypothetical protein